MNFNKIMEQIAISFLNAWAKRDFELMSTYFTKDVEFESPNVSKIFPYLVSNKLKGADKLTEYFIQFSTHAPDFNFDLSRTTFNKDENKMVMHGRLDNTDIEIDSNFQFNEYGKFIFISINYPNNK
jgi:hypothetical protein